MAVTVTALELSAALRLGDGQTALIEPTAGIVNRLLSVGTELVQKYAPNAPDEIQNEAVIRVAFYLYDAPPHNSRGRYQHALTQSGASALLSMYREPRAVLIVESEDSE